MSTKGGRERLVTGAVATATAGLALGAFALSGTATARPGPQGPPTPAGPPSRPSFRWSPPRTLPRLSASLAPGGTPTAALPPTPPPCARSSITSRAVTCKYPGSALPDALDPVTYQQADGPTATDLYRHPLVGDLTLDCDTWTGSDGSGQRLTVLTAPADGPSHNALRILASRTARRAHPGRTKGRTP
ncbi:hypothetical protein [Streptomyces sp. NPDC006739]|uniref:hypothetical protein n=1 Tax=Streptomyces sp. NPDC006739 TaxID=3364763 RepID=UPI0036A659DC